MRSELHRLRRVSVFLVVAAVALPGLIEAVTWDLSDVVPVNEGPGLSGACQAVASAAEGKNKCAATAGCVAFTYSPSLGHACLKAAISGAYDFGGDAPGYSFYFMTQERSGPPSPWAIPETPQEREGAMIESARLFGNLNKYAYYFTDLLVGSPVPQRTSVIVDTGSRIAGFPCRGCQHCGQHLDEPFDVNRSSTARWLACGAGCSGDCIDGRCAYKETYSEGSSISGRWFDDVVGLSGSLRAGLAGGQNPQVRARLGCHSWVDKLFYTQRANGIMGLAPAGDVGTDATPTVLQDLFRDHAHISTKVFALCLATWGGLLTVGGYFTGYHKGHIHWIRMHASKYYFVFPSSLSLVLPGESSDASVAIASFASPVVPDDFGVTLIDSGTTYSYFPGLLFNNIVSSLAKYCGDNGGCEAERDSSECWRLRDTAGGPRRFPTLLFHFQAGATVEWSPFEYLHERGARGVWCQTFMENNLHQTVLGISWMLHKDIIFDLAGSRLGVAIADCPEHHRSEDEEVEVREAAVQRKFQRLVPHGVAEDVARAREPDRSKRHQFLRAGGVVLAGAMAALLAVSAARAKRLSPRLAPSAARLSAEGCGDEAEAELEVQE